MKSKSLTKSPNVKTSLKISNPTQNKKAKVEKSQKNSKSLLAEIRKRYESLNERTLIVYRAAIKNINFYKKHIDGIVCAKVVNNKHKSSIGHVFLKFDKAESAKNALKFFQDKDCKAAICTEKQKETEDKSAKRWRMPEKLSMENLLAKHLYVDCIPPLIKKEEIEKLFTDIAAINYPQSESGMNNGHAFIEFKTQEAAINNFMKHKDTILVDSHKVSSSINVNFQIKRCNNAAKRILKKSTEPRPQMLSAKQVDNFLKCMQENAAQEMEKSLSSSKIEKPKKDVGMKRKLESDNEDEAAIKSPTSKPRKSLKKKVKQ